MLALGGKDDSITSADGLRDCVTEWNVNADPDAKTKLNVDGGGGAGGIGAQYPVTLAVTDRESSASVFGGLGSNVSVPAGACVVIAKTSAGWTEIDDTWTEVGVDTFATVGVSFSPNAYGELQNPNANGPDTGHLLPLTGASLPTVHFGEPLQDTKEDPTETPTQAAPTGEGDSDAPQSYEDCLDDVLRT